MMRRFPQRALLSRRRVTPDIVDRIAERLAMFHAGIAVATVDSPRYARCGPKAPGGQPCGPG
jgi:aminoglycoside phosphotransferase family enzyme